MAHSLLIMFLHLGDRASYAIFFIFLISVLLIFFAHDNLRTLIKAGSTKRRVRREWRLACSTALFGRANMSGCHLKISSSYLDTSGLDVHGTENELQMGGSFQKWNCAFRIYVHFQLFGVPVESFETANLEKFQV